MSLTSPACSSMVAVGHMELFKYEVNENLSSSVAVATFLLSHGQVLLVAATLDHVDKGLAMHGRHCRALLTRFV